MFDDLRGLLEKYHSEGYLTTITGADWDIELGAITEVVAEDFGKAVLFDEIKGYPKGYRVSTNHFITKELFAMAIGMSPDTTKLELVQRFRNVDYKPLKPIEVNNGPVMENVKIDQEVNLFDIPVPKYHEHDGGRYMGTGHIVIMKDPDTGYINAGVQRAVVHDRNTLGIHIVSGKHNGVIMKKYFDRGESCPVVMAFSPDPITYICAVLSIPWGVSELDYAGWIKGKPLEVIKGEFTGLPFPARDEIVIEGEILQPDVETRSEGPFGEWTGYYAGGIRKEPIVRVKAIYHRNNPILSGNPPMKPSIAPFAGFAIPITTAPAIWDNLEAAGVRGIKGVWQLEGGGERCIPVVSIKQDHPGHPKQAGFAVLGSHGGGNLSRYVIVVDDDIDPTNTDDVIWAIATRCDPERQIDIVKGCWGSALDPILSPTQRKEGDVTHSTAVIDACKPFNWKADFPLINEFDSSSKKEILAKWREQIIAGIAKTY